MKDLYTEITNRMIEQLEAGVIPWRKPWAGTPNGAISHATGRPYSLINQFILKRPGEYLTFNQIQQEGGRIKKGSRASFVVFWKAYTRQKKDDAGAPVLNDDGTPKLETLPVLRYFQVFHIDDTEGIAPKYPAEETARPEPVEAAENALQGYVQREGIRLENILTDEAFYSPSRDYIHLPLIEQFDNAEEYYSTAFHEATHSTGHKTRLDRFPPDMVAAAFGSESYSKEELVAEIGAASILHILGMETPQTFKNSSAYIQSWLRALKNDKRLIISAAARAEKAVNLILDIHEEPAAVNS